MLKWRRKQLAFMVLASALLLSGVVWVTTVSGEGGVPCDNWSNMCWYDAACNKRCVYYECISEPCGRRILPNSTTCGKCEAGPQE